MKILGVFLVFALCLPAQAPLTVTLAPKAEVKADVEVPFEVTVKDSKGALVEGASVQVVATMVEMDHGEFKYDAKPVKKGVYQFNPKFMMGGAWNLAVKAKKGDVEASASRRVEVKD